MSNHLTEHLESYLDNFRDLPIRDLSPEDVAMKAKDLLTRLFDDYSKTAELGLLQRRIYPFVRGISYASTNMLSSFISIPIDLEPINKSGWPSLFTFNAPMELVLQLLPPIILILAFLFSANFIVILLGVIWLLSVVILRNRNNHSNRQLKSSEAKIDVAKISDALKTIVSDADQLMQEASDLDEQKKIKKVGFWGDNPDILDLLHDFTEILETGDAEYAMKKLRVVPAILKAKGLRLISYDGANKDWFDFFPAPDDAYSAPETIKPALLFNEDLVRRGTVIQSAKH
jgi:hypothetical protein